MYNPNEPRDAEGKWTAFDASEGLLKAASGNNINEKDEFLNIADVDKTETGKAIQAKAYRFEKGSADSRIKFYSKEKDYVEQYASLFHSDSSAIKEHTVIMKNPFVINAPNHLFSSPAYENPIINKVLLSGKYDGIIFKNQEDVFYVTIKEGD